MRPPCKFKIGDEVVLREDFSMDQIQYIITEISKSYFNDETWVITAVEKDDLLYEEAYTYCFYDRQVRSNIKLQMSFEF